MHVQLFHSLSLFVDKENIPFELLFQDLTSSKHAFYSFKHIKHPDPGEFQTPITNQPHTDKPPDKRSTRERTNNKIRSKRLKNNKRGRREEIGGKNRASPKPSSKDV